MRKIISSRWRLARIAGIWLAGGVSRRIRFALAAGFVPWLAVGCGAPQPLEIKTYVLRDQLHDVGGDPMVRNEKLRRLHGAVSMEERRNLLGQYHTVRWRDPDGAGTAPVTVTFEYQQGATASLVKRKVETFAADDAGGTAEFSVIGDDYFNGGRVLAWRATLRRGGNVVATRQSYLWQ